MTVTHIFFDVGGVLGTNGWDHDQAAAVVSRFGLDVEEFRQRHLQIVEPWETGRLALDQYLDHTVFHRERPFSREAFRDSMLAVSAPFPEVIALARGLSRAGRYHLATLNNESSELNAYRIRHFALAEIFDAFCSSCWIGGRKPDRLIYDRALAIMQADPARSVFIDDRASNLETAEALGMRTILFRDAIGLGQALADFGIALRHLAPDN